MPAEALPSALQEGRIDAFSMREPQVGQALAQFRDRAVVFAEPGLYYKIFSLVTTETALKVRSSAAEKVLQALVLAERFLLDHPQKAKNRVAQMIGIDPVELDKLWPAFNFKLSLGQLLLTSLQEEGRWIQENDRITEEKVPNLLNLIDTNTLEHVDSEAVHVFP